MKLTRKKHYKSPGPFHVVAFYSVLSISKLPKDTVFMFVCLIDFFIIILLLLLLFFVTNPWHRVFSK